jgi:hypothetical protein
MKRPLALAALLFLGLGCGIRGAPHPPLEPSAPPDLPPGGSQVPNERPAARGPFNPASPPDAGSAPVSAEPTTTSDAGTSVAPDEPTEADAGTSPSSVAPDAATPPAAAGPSAPDAGT